MTHTHTHLINTYREPCDICSVSLVLSINLKEEKTLIVMLIGFSIRFRLTSSQISHGTLFFFRSLVPI